MSDPYTRFAEYVESIAREPFCYGVYDCLIFTNNAVRALTGNGFADDIIGRYSQRGAVLHERKLIDTFGFRSFPDFLDSRLKRIDHINMPRGSVVAIARQSVPYYALGIAFGSGIVTCADYGTSWVDLDLAVMAWTAFGET